MVTPTRVAAATTTELNEARAWLSDCTWADADPDLIAEMPAVTIFLAIERHYEGGWRAFRRDTNLTVEYTEVTLYRVVADDGEDPLHVLVARWILGRDDADHEAANLICRPDVMTVSCEPLPWDTDAERDAIVDAYYDDEDRGALHAALCTLARRVGADFDPENFDPIALLDHLRSAHHNHQEAQRSMKRQEPRS